MDNTQYRKFLVEIVRDGKGYDAIRQITEMLGKHSESMERVLEEASSERNAIKKFCNSKQSDRDKVSAIRALL